MWKTEKILTFSHNYCLLNLQNIPSCFRILNAGAEEKQNMNWYLKRTATFALHCYCPVSDGVGSDCSLKCRDLQFFKFMSNSSPAPPDTTHVQLWEVVEKSAGTSLPKAQAPWLVTTA